MDSMNVEGSEEGIEGGAGKEMGFGLRPKYLRYNLWSPEADPSVTAAKWTLTALPLPRPPKEELGVLEVITTLQDHSNLFKVVSPIKVDVLEELAKEHPNQPFVDSVLTGFREGFWPWAETVGKGYPPTHDERRVVKGGDEKDVFMRKQLEHERGLGRFSDSFGENLLPGMYCMPNYAVPKPNSSDFRLVNDHSAGPFSLNSMVDHDKVTGYPLDNLSQLGERIIRRSSTDPDKRLVIWKSDIAEAYRNCPMHPAWQIKQAVRVDCSLYVDRGCVFGNSASPAIFIAFNALIAWIAKYVRGIDLLIYVDDSFGLDEEGNQAYYAHYDAWFPRQQVKLLELWDELGVPHKLKKQLWGSSLAVIGLDVDPNEASILFPVEAKERLMKELLEWCKKGVRKTVREWQQLAGWINWALNVFPLLKPALNNMYPKIRGKSLTSKVWVNKVVKEDLEWARGWMEKLSDVLMMKSLSWGINDATHVIYCNACPQGMGFWYPALKRGFTALTPSGSSSTLNNFFESICVLSALRDATARSPDGSKFVIYSDSFTAVSMFNSLRALPDYNCILKAAVDFILGNDNDLRVLHVAGESNGVADALSRFDLSHALQLCPGLQVSSFEPYQRVERPQLPALLQPPRVPLGVAGI